MKLSLRLSLLAISAAAAAQGAAGWYPVDAREAALGGAHIAYADAARSLQRNPAALASAPSGLVVSETSVKLSGPVFDMIGMATAGADLTNILSGIGNLFDDSGRFYAALDLCGPLWGGFTLKGFGLNMGMRTRVTANAASLLRIGALASEDVFVSAGYGYKIKGGSGTAWELGLGLKGFADFNLGLQTNILGITSVIQDVGGLMDTLPIGSTYGVGLDAGLRFTAWNGRFALGISGIDALSHSWNWGYPSINGLVAAPLPGESDFVLQPCNLSAGLYIDPYLGVLGRYITALRIMLDYSDIIGSFAVGARNPVLNAAAGAELVLHDILSLRAGISEGLFSAGFGLNLTIMNLDFAMYGTELGREPGTRPVYNVQLGLRFGSV
jgi:hypothetical protein